MTGRISAALLASALALACGAEEEALNTEAAERPATQAVTAGCLPTGDGYLRVRLSGSLTADIDWPDSGTSCDGMERPDGSGARVTFSRNIYEEDNRLILVFGINGIQEGKTGKSYPVNITLIREGRGEFYGTLGGDSCEVDVQAHDAIQSTAKLARLYKIEAAGRCREPVPAVVGDGKVHVGEFNYTGIVIWEGPPDAATD